MVILEQAAEPGVSDDFACLPPLTPTGGPDDARLFGGGGLAGLKRRRARGLGGWRGLHAQSAGARVTGAVRHRYHVVPLVQGCWRHAVCGHRRGRSRVPPPGTLAQSRSPAYGTTGPSGRAQQPGPIWRRRHSVPSRGLALPNYWNSALKAANASRRASSSARSSSTAASNWATRWSSSSSLTRAGSG